MNVKLHMAMMLVLVIAGFFGGAWLTGHLTEWSGPWFIVAATLAGLVVQALFTWVIPARCLACWHRTQCKILSYDDGPSVPLTSRSRMMISYSCRKCSACYPARTVKQTECTGDGRSKRCK